MNLGGTLDWLNHSGTLYITTVIVFFFRHGTCIYDLVGVFTGCSFSGWFFQWYTDNIVKNHQPFSVILYILQDVICWCFTHICCSTLWQWCEKSAGWQGDFNRITMLVLYHFSSSLFILRGRNVWYCNNLVLNINPNHYLFIYFTNEINYRCIDQLIALIKCRL